MALKKEDMQYRKIKKINRYWVSWYTKNNETEAPFQYWTTGWRLRDDAATCVAVVDAPNKNSIRIAIKKLFPDYEERFIEQKENDFVPGSRFSNFESKTSFA